MELELDQLYADDGGFFYYPSRGWTVEREVDYNGSKLVPVLPTEVPFDYSFIEFDLVFLWDRAERMAVGVLREAARVDWSTVPHRDSKLALFGSCEDPPGYCYQQLQREPVDLGPYPTVDELKASGTVFSDEGLTFEEKRKGVYHCTSDGDGSSWYSLHGSAVVGATVTVEGFLGYGLTRHALGVARDARVRDRLSVVGAAVVDIGTVYKAGLGSNDRSEQVDLKWIGHVEVDTGKYLSMGIVESRFVDGLSGCVSVKLPDGVDVVYWHIPDGGGGRTGYACGRSDQVVIGVPFGLHGFYVYALSDNPMSGVKQPIAFTGTSSGCKCYDCHVGGQVDVDGCYLRLMSRDRVRLHGCCITWLDVLESKYLAVPDELAEWRVTRMGPSDWHVSAQGDLAVCEVVPALRRALSRGERGANIDGCMVMLSDTVGSASAMARVLKERVTALASFSLEAVDEAGARLAGMPASDLSSADKVRAKVLQTVGDNVVSLVVAESVLDAGGTPQAYQELRSVVSSNAFLRDRFDASSFRGSFHGGTGVLAPRTGGSAVESLVAVVYRLAGVAAARELLVLLGVIE